MLQKGCERRVNAELGIERRSFRISAPGTEKGAVVKRTVDLANGVPVSGTLLMLDMIRYLISFGSKTT